MSFTTAAGSFLEAAVRTATPLAFAALGETVAERAGVLNLGLEGVIIAGAFGAFVGAGLATGAAGAALGFALGAVAGVAAAALFAAFAVALRADQIITGTAVTLAALGLTGTLYRVWYGSGPAGAALPAPVATSAPLAIPGLSALPLVGRALFAQPIATYALYALAPALAWWLRRTHAGLALRAVGERPDAARAAGVRPARVQLAAVLAGGLLGGVAGATLVVAQAGTFVEGMSAGRGFIAIAVVVLGRWEPLGVLAAALLFGASSALQYLFQAMGWALPYQLFLAAPYLLTLVVLAAAGAAAPGGRGTAPAALGRRSLSG